MKITATLLLFLFASFHARSQDINDQLVSAFNASYAAENNKDYAKAINDLKAVYRENSYETNLRLGWLYSQKKENENSEKYYRAAMKLRPSSIEAMLGFVVPAAAAQNWAEVFSTYQKILTIDANHSLANYRIALMYYYRKEFANAEKHLQKVIDHYPFDYDIVLLMAQTKLALNKLAESKTYYQRALLYNPSSSDIKAMVNKL